MNKQKGIVFENTSSYSIFLTDDGRFLKGIPDVKSVQVGEEVSFRPYVEMVTMKKPKRTAYMVPIIAAVAIIFMFFTVLLPSQNKVSAYVQVDFNPSIELGIDNEGNVQVFRGINDDGIAIKRDISFWKGKSLTWVLLKIVEESEVTFESDDQFGVTTIISEGKNKPALEELIQTAVLQTTVKIAPENIQVKKATIEERLQANEKGVSVGTYKDAQEKVKPLEKAKQKPAISQPKEPKIKAKSLPSQNDKQEQRKNKDEKRNNEKKKETQELKKELKNHDKQDNNQQRRNEKSTDHSKSNDQRSTEQNKNNNEKSSANQQNSSQQKHSKKNQSEKHDRNNRYNSKDQRSDDNQKNHKYDKNHNSKRSNDK
jgi:outer membrane biosynthesis protein TonB